jgi:Pre-mRNA splicing factor PRP21 like protein
LQVVKDYVRAEAAPGYDASQFVVSPITGELVPLAEMKEHMRINLLDPKWKDQRDAMLAKIRGAPPAAAPWPRRLSNNACLFNTRQHLCTPCMETVDRVWSNG